jgi:2,5-furandicarboxylate decarboxylase 1
MAKDMRSFIKQVVTERPGEVVAVEQEVDPKFEITGIASKLGLKGQYPALICEKVKGSKVPVIINLTATYERLALALGTTVEKMVQDYAFRPRTKVPPAYVEPSKAPVKEVVLKGKEAKLSVLPIPTHNEHDCAPYITSGLMICRDPDTGAINAGLYRHQKQEEDQLGVWFLGVHHGGYIQRRYSELNKEMEVAIAIGHHPAFVMGCVSRVPGIGGEFEEAGGLLGEPVRVVKGETVDLPVPADAEIIIEGVIPPNKTAFEGPFAEWPGSYVAEGDKPFILVKAITMRKDAIYYDVFNANREHTVLGSLPRMGSIFRCVKQYVPGVKMVNVPAHSRMHCYISIKKERDEEVKRAAFAAYLTEPDNLKLVIVVDDDIDVFNDQEVLWAIGTRFRAEKGLLVIPEWSGPGGLNPVGYDYHTDGTKSPIMTAGLVIDATKPDPSIPYPPRARVPQEVLNRLDIHKLVRDLKEF